MSLFPVPPRQVKIGDAASFVGVTPRAIRHYHEVGLLPEPERGDDGHRRYGSEAMIRLLWVRKMADAGIQLDDIRDAFADDDAADDEHAADIERALERLARTLDSRLDDLQHKRTAVERMRARGSKVGLLSEFVGDRLDSAAGVSLRPADLDSLLVTERIFGPLGAAVQASRFIALCSDPLLRQESDRIDAAEEALDDSVAVDDPRVEQVAGERHAFEQKLQVVIEESGLDQSDEALFDAWETLHPSPAGGDIAGVPGERSSTSASKAVQQMPYDFSPARVRCMELAMQLATRE